MSAKGADLHSIERDAQRLYELIWCQFVACQMTAAEYLTTTIKVQADSYGLKARGKPNFIGYQAVLPIGGKGDDAELPDVQVGDQLDLITLDPVTKIYFTAARYNEASLVRELEKQGIDVLQPMQIISTVQDRGYVEMDGRRLFATKYEIVTDRLIENFSDLMNYDLLEAWKIHWITRQKRKDWIGLLDILRPV